MENENEKLTQGIVDNLMLCAGNSEDENGICAVSILYLNKNNYNPAFLHQKHIFFNYDLFLPSNRQVVQFI